MPREFADVLRAHLAELTEEMIGEIRAGVPEYSRPGDEKYVKAVRRAVEEALRLFLARIAGDGDEQGRAPEVYRAIGRGEASEGRPLDSLQAALRICARVAWRRLALASETLDLSRERLCAVGEAILVYLDEIAAAAAEGYAEAQIKVAGELELRRRRLLDLLVAGPPADLRAVEDLARAAGWTMPRSVAGVALAARPLAAAFGDREPPGHPAMPPSVLGLASASAAVARTAGPVNGTVGGVARPALPPDVLAALDRPDPFLVLPDPEAPGRTALLDRALRDWVVVLGPPVPVREAAQSLRLAREALDLTRRGLLPSGRETGAGRSAPAVVRCADHLATMVVCKDEALVRIIRRTRLAPLRGLRAGQRDRVAETLLAWLQCGHNANEVAARLHVHPQTVRYRLRQAMELFGDQLGSPDDRFELEIALRARALEPPRTGGR
ncbi:Fis family transcriptional regulator [Sphaerisporangium melleum]|uniref:Fis family transcriptional regulator n=1 Tax=Sphaerisporangium melleum TaxID=321316 RepID=A0A917VJ33_9ACTN|nr:Fis family transcriptional regulator [Sphaerisporangium melleum]GII67762.1 Fis family transcriptional regulator [Sphaerisporangium melleum]